ncbi:MAG TPA: SLC13 family permease [Tissierellaceae bacterium]|nr:SLC13 family permease [Tissierellaceae bacterium]
MGSQIIVFSVILITLILFIEGSIRYEFVSLAGLIVLTITGIISPEEAFLGFGHPAVITVASVLVISAALVKSGVIELLVSLLNKGAKSLTYKVASLMLVTALLSGFMNNVGALALIMPIAIRVAKDSNVPPSQFLMPVAFASLLGGMVTAIGTPPNLIVSSYLIEAGKEEFAFFDFAPVGLVMVAIGILFTITIGKKLIPQRKSNDEESLFDIEDYLSEIVVGKDSKMRGKPLREFHTTYNLGVDILSILRNKQKIIAPDADEYLWEGDVLIVKAESKELTELVKRTGLSLKGAKIEESDSPSMLNSSNIALVEVVLRDDSFLIGRTALETKLRNRYNVNLVAVSRKGISSFGRLKSFRFNAGDVLLMQVPSNIAQDIFSKLGCLPLAHRELGVSVEQSQFKKVLPLSLFTLAIIVTTLGLLPVQISFAFTAVVLVISKVLTPREFYDAIEWPTIIMLGSLLPLGDALQSSGGSETIANVLMKMSTILSPSMMVGLLIIITMILTNLISNTASAILMAPIAFTVSEFMGVSPEPLLMGVAVASSSAFLTPIAHQSNMLVMGPGGYNYTDYWYLGLPLSLLVVLIGTPLILYVWPL